MFGLYDIMTFCQALFAALTVAAPATGDQAMKLIVPMIALIIVAVVLVVIVIVALELSKNTLLGLTVATAVLEELMLNLPAQLDALITIVVVAPVVKLSDDLFIEKLPAALTFVGTINIKIINIINIIKFFLFNLVISHSP